MLEFENNFSFLFLFFFLHILNLFLHTDILTFKKNISISKINNIEDVNFKKSFAFINQFKNI